MTRVLEVDQFVESLADADLPDDRSVNVYLDTTRCENLRRWFNTFEDTSQSAIFVGEALGRDGGAITGIPFVSPDLMTRGVSGWEDFGPSSPYQVPPGSNFSQRERSATRFWKHVPTTLCGLPRPLTWNLYPFWPCEVSVTGKAKNRTPSKAEIEYGTNWLTRLIAMYRGARVVAVGVKARETLHVMGIDAPQIPHPSRGTDDRLTGALVDVAKLLRSGVRR